MLCVRKPDNSLRLCVDYRLLNAKTVADNQPIPKVQETLKNLGGNRWFTTLDQGKAYHQGFMSEKSQSWGLYEFVRKPFGLSQAQGAFQRFTERVIGSDLRDVIAIPYLDDVICFRKNFYEHLEHLRIIFKRLRESGIKLKPRKCKMFRKQVQFMGRVVTEQGYTLDPKSIEAVTSLRSQTPRTVGDVRKLLDFLSYFWRWIPQFVAITKPLYNLTSTLKEPKRQQKTHTSKRNNKRNQLSSSIPVQWTDDHQLAIEKLTVHLTKAPFLAFPQHGKPFAVHVDACEYGLDTAPYQRQDGKLRVIAYGSPAEKNYSLHSGKLEFLALKWSVTEFFRGYLCYSNDFVVYTDNNPLTYLLSTAKLNAT